MFLSFVTPVTITAVTKVGIKSGDTTIFLIISKPHVTLWGISQAPFHEKKRAIRLLPSEYSVSLQPYTTGKGCMGYGF
jgi:hypothetical protein